MLEKPHTNSLKELDQTNNLLIFSELFLDANPILARDGASPPDTELSVEKTLEEVAEVSSPEYSDKGTQTVPDETAENTNTAATSADSPDALPAEEVPATGIQRSPAIMVKEKIGAWRNGKRGL